MITVDEESLRPSVGEHRGRAVFILYKNTISSNSSGRPWRVGIAATACLVFRIFRCCFWVESFVDAWSCAARSDAGCFRRRPRIRMGVRSIGSYVKS
jgi:hypothetical protein